MNPLESLYYLGYSLKKSYALSRRKRLPFPVISIGNITVGGTGKTPAAMAVAEEAQKRGFYPVILTRGYRGKAEEPCFVGTSEPSAPERYGDEPVLMAEKLKGVPVVKCADRYEGGMFAVRQLKSRIANHASRLLFILDDGFQHWRLHRDKDILLIDAENPFGNRRLLPAGRLREPLEEIARAEGIIITRSDEQREESLQALEHEIRRHNSTAPIYRAVHVPTALEKHSGEILPAGAARGRKFFGFCAIGNPESFRKTIVTAGGRVEGLRYFRDHATYSQEDIERVGREAREAGADWIVTTEKDIIKLKNLDLPENIYILKIAFSVRGSFFEDVFRL